MTTTSFDVIISRFLKKVENDDKFFTYYNVDDNEAESIIKQRSIDLLLEALDYLSYQSLSQVDFKNYDKETEIINFRLTTYEINMIAEIMFYLYMKKDLAKLHAQEIAYTPSDLQIFSPANERNSYKAMIKDLKTNVKNMVGDYNARDRETGKLKTTIHYSAYSDV